MNLQLSLIEIWFRLTKLLIKKEDYRNITPYWCNRFILVEGNIMPKKWWNEKFNYSGNIFTDNIKWIIDNIKIGNFSFNSFTHNRMTLGYPSASDTSRIITLEHKGIEIREGNPEWGAEVGKLYFVIKHGQKI